MRATLLATAVVLLLGSSAQAIYIGFDVEGNDTVATANPLVSDIAIVNARFAACTPGAAEVGLGSLAAGAVQDVDFYSVTIPAGCIVTAIVTPLDPTFTNPPMSVAGGDSFGPFAGGQPGGVNNWFGPLSVGSAIQFIANPLPDGLTIFAVGAPQLGQGPAVGRYAFTVSVVPEPGTLAMLASGLLLVARRRRR